ncbi:hypothetical protein [Xanthobacter agilis]|uniref:Uncharacterized protein n=1 Tax=Xanthobacter agilis TaxID=47492 RepID=A0ABU0LFW4_XANAG|nr:hypothetical protein [Xanthobacter agilis]MDQ0506003.1 hypothetical protein [Xanthobacter agilis]
MLNLASMSISARLHRLGYEHRKAGNDSELHYVVHTQTGRAIGLLSAFGAAVFCRQVEAGVDEREVISGIAEKVRSAMAGTTQEAA